MSPEWPEGLASHCGPQQGTPELSSEFSHVIGGQEMEKWLKLLKLLKLWNIAVLFDTAKYCEAFEAQLCQGSPALPLPRFRAGCTSKQNLFR